MEKNFLRLSQTVKNLKKVQAEIIVLQRKYSRMRNLERKQDTRKKIQFGGLIIKAGLEDESTATLLGILLEAKEKLDNLNSEPIKLSWKIKGDIALTSIKK